MIKPLQFLQKATGIVIWSRLKKRLQGVNKQQQREDKQFAIATKMDAGLYDMLRSTLDCSQDAISIFIFGTIAGKSIIFEEWTIYNRSFDELQVKMALRSLLIVSNALQYLPLDSHFSINSAPTETLPISEHQMVEGSNPEMEPFDVIEIAGGIGNVKCRRNMQHVHDHPISRPTEPLESKREFVPNSFESINNPSLESSRHQQSQAAPTDDTSELTNFLRRLESRPSLPGLYSDGWLSDFGDYEGGWEGIVKDWLAVRDKDILTEEDDDDHISI